MLRRTNVSVLLFTVTLGVSAQERTPNIPSLTATIDDIFTRKLADGNTVTKIVVGTFYRDAQGRTRTERDQLVTIQDPTTRTNVVIDMRAKVARRFRAAPSDPPPGTQRSMTEVTGRQHHRDLGTQIIEGVFAKGVEFSVVVSPGAVGNLRPLTQTSAVWRSDELALPIKVTSSDPLNGEHVQVFRNIVKDAHVDQALFTIPSDVQVVDVQPAPRSGSQRLR